jgi:hypothetical protein
MLATLTLMSALSLAPAQTGGDLEVTNVRTTFGRLGPTRKDTKYLPGDRYWLSFDVGGLQFDEKGVANYSIFMEVFDSGGKSKYKSLDVPKVLNSVQGSGKIPLDAFLDITSDTKAGMYTVEVTVSQNVGTEAKPDKKTAKAKGKLEVGEKEFSIVRVHCAYDIVDTFPNTPLFPTGGAAVVGQTVRLFFALSNFERHEFNKKNVPALQLQMRVLDDKGEPTLKKPLVEALPKEDDVIPESLTVLPLFFPLALTKPGKYTLEITATDQVSKKTATATYPLVISEPPK